MKKRFVLFAGVAMSLTTVFIACKKDQSVPAKTPITATANGTKAATRVTINATVSQRGFLVFNAQADVDAYADFLLSSTLAEVSQYHSSIGFTSLAGSKYSKLDQNSLVTEDQLKDFMLDAKSLMQIGTTIFRTTDDNLYLLTMPESQLNDNSYALIATGKYNGRQMNRFAVNIQRDLSFDLLATIGGTSFGINETDPGGPAQIMKFWGKKDYYSPCNGGMRLHTTRYYMFFVKAAEYDQVWEPC